MSCSSCQTFELSCTYVRCLSPPPSRLNSRTESVPLLSDGEQLLETTPNRAVAEGRTSIGVLDNGFPCLIITDPGLAELVENNLDLATAIVRVQRNEVFDYLGPGEHRQLLEVLYDAGDRELSVWRTLTTSPSSMRLQLICMTLLLRKADDIMKHVLVDHTDDSGDRWVVPGFLKRIDTDDSNATVEVEIAYQVGRALVMHSYFVSQDLHQLNDSGVWFRHEGNLPAGRIKRPPYEIDIAYFDFHGPGIPQRINFGISSSTQPEQDIMSA